MTQPPEGGAVNRQDAFDVSVSALREGLAKHFDIEAVQPFGDDIRAAGVKADFDLGAVSVHLALWSNGSFDLEALDLASGDLVLRRSVSDATPAVIVETLERLDSWTDPVKRAGHPWST